MKSRATGRATSASNRAWRTSRRAASTSPSLSAPRRVSLSNTVPRRSVRLSNISRYRSTKCRDWAHGLNVFNARNNRAIAQVRERAVGEEVVKSVTPGQMVVKIVNDTVVLYFPDRRWPRVPTEYDKV